jgi:hypothetical protein
VNRRRLIPPLVAALVAAVPATAQARAPQSFPLTLPGDAAAAGVSADRETWIVGARPGDKARAIARRFGARHTGLRGSGGYVVAREQAKALAAALRERGLLEYAHPNQLLKRQGAVPDDPLSVPPNNWRAVVVDPALNPPPVTPTSPLIALVDSPLDPTHPEFAGGNTATLAPPGTPITSSHGTATASVAAAPQNGTGILGVWPGARALNIPLPDNITCDAAADAEAQAIQQGAAVINMSFGGQSLCVPEFVTLQGAVASGIIPVAAAGNEFQEGNPVEFPASLPHVLTAAATDFAGNSSFFSNANAAIDVSAPGEPIMSAVPAALDSDGTADGYQQLQGTSFSAPMVAAATAWVRAARPDLLPDQAAQVIRLSARDLAPEGYDANTGFGMLQIGAALSQQPPPHDPLEPNDDIIWVDGRAFDRPAPVIFNGRRRVQLVGLLDAFEDPVDVYRVKVNGRSRARVTVTPVFGDPFVTGHSRKARNLDQRRVARSRKRGDRTERITLRNRSRRATTFYVAVGVQSNRILDSGYAMTVRR